jgi:hypothetical protein
VALESYFFLFKQGFSSHSVTLAPRRVRKRFKKIEFHKKIIENLALDIFNLFKQGFAKSQKVWFGTIFLR